MSCECQKVEGTNKKILIMAFLLNFTLFVVGLIAGIIAQSTGLLADSLDMLADSSIYAIALLAVNRGYRFKTIAAALSGVFLLILGVGVLIDAGEKFTHGSNPTSLIIIFIASLALIVNSTVLYFLQR